MAVRRFDGDDDLIAIPNPSALDAPCTLAALVRVRVSPAMYNCICRPVGNGNSYGFGLVNDASGRLILTVDGAMAANSPAGFVAVDAWRLVAVTVPPGQVVIPRFHSFDVEASSWTRADFSSQLGSAQASTGGTLGIGRVSSSLLPLAGDVAALAVWSSELTDAEVSALAATALTGWRDIGAPKALVVLDQLQPNAPVVNRITGQAATSVVGTTIVDEMPPIPASEPIVRMKVGDTWLERGLYSRVSGAWRTPRAIGVLR